MREKVIVNERKGEYGREGERKGGRGGETVVTRKRRKVIKMIDQ